MYEGHPLMEGFISLPTGGFELSKRLKKNLLDDNTNLP